MVTVPVPLPPSALPAWVAGAAAAAAAAVADAWPGAVGSNAQTAITAGAALVWAIIVREHLLTRRVTAVATINAVTRTATPAPAPAAGVTVLGPVVTPVPPVSAAAHIVAEVEQAIGLAESLLPPVVVPQ